MKFKQWYVIAGLFFLGATLLPALITQAQEGTPPTPTLQAQGVTPPPGQAVGPNLLVNPGFEGIGESLYNPFPNYDNWTRDTFNGAQYGEIFTPEGWATWWEEGEYGRPECKVIPNEPPFNVAPVRIHAGYYSGMCFGFYRKPHAGLYQVVRNIPPNSVVEGAYMAHSWSCGEDNPPLSCGDLTAFYFRVGIDPNGDTDPFSKNIVWSEPYYHHDKFARVGPIQATVGITGVATLFLEATAKWPSKHNDAYWDNARLNIVVTGTLPTATPPPPPPTSDQFQRLTPPSYTPTPPPDGSIIHTVVEGDSLLGIAITYGIDDVGELRRLNAGMGRADSILAVGQKIVVRAGLGGHSPTPTPTVVQTPSMPLATVQPNAPAGDKGAICVLAFYDANGDQVQQSENGEVALSNAEITVVRVDGILASHRTNGSEPYCFQNLQAGQSYIVRHTPPPGYTADVGSWNLLLSSGQVYPIELAYNRAQDIAPKTLSSSLIWRISGGLVLLLAGVGGIYFILSRRA